MLTGNLVRVKTTSKGRIIPSYLNRDDPRWLEVAESLLLIFREGVRDDPRRDRGRDRRAGRRRAGDAGASRPGQGAGGPGRVRGRGRRAARRRCARRSFLGRRRAQGAWRRRPAPAASGRRSAARRCSRPVAVELKPRARGGRRGPLRRPQGREPAAPVRRPDRPAADRPLQRRAGAGGLAPLGPGPRSRSAARSRRGTASSSASSSSIACSTGSQGSMAEGYTFHIDGPLSLFSATNKYGLQMALFLPALLHLPRLPARRRAPLGTEARAADVPPRLGRRPGLAHRRHRHLCPRRGRRVPRTVPPGRAGVGRDRGHRPDRAGREGVWVPDYRFVHRRTGTDVFVEVLGFLEAFERRAAAPASAAVTVRSGSSWRSPSGSRSMRRRSARCPARSSGSRRSPAPPSWPHCSTGSSRRLATVTGGLLSNEQRV